MGYPSTPMAKFITRTALMAGLVICSRLAMVPAIAGDKDPVNPAPTAQDWQALAKLPDWSGVWTPVISDQHAQEKSNRPPWNPQTAKHIDHMWAEEDAGRPFPIIDHCFPTGMPSWMLITHNALEILFTPGRITILGEGDGNRLRRIYTDGRPHPADPDPSFHGHSIGHWENDTLVVDTVAVLPQAYLAVSEAVGVPNNGDMHIVERLHLQGPDTLADDLEITAGKVLTKSWRTTRKYYRQRAQKYDIVEGVCAQGSFTEAVDKDGNSIFAPVKFHNGVPVGSQSK
jgi:hypothetical protein